MMRLSKASMIAGAVGKVAYALTSVGLLAKSVGRKAINTLNYRGKYYLTITDRETGLVIVDTAKRSTSEIINILESLRDADIRVTLERSKHK